MNDPMDNSEQLQEEVVSPQRKDNPPKKKPTCKLSILAAFSLLLIVPVFVAMIIFADSQQHKELLQLIGTIIAGFSIIGSPIIAVLSKIRIALSDNRLEGNRVCNLIIVFACFLLLYIGSVPFLAISKQIAERIVCHNNLKGLGQAICAYADEHDDQLPTAEQWCDILVTKAYVLHNMIRCRTSGDVEGESSYAINKNVLGKKLSELPDDMVLLFEANIGKSEDKRDCFLKEREFIKQKPGVTSKNPEKHKIHKDRWNQIGGPEDMTQAHSGGTIVLYVNGDVEFIQFRYPNLREDSELKNLCWDTIQTSTPLSAYTSIGEKYHNTPQPLIKTLLAVIAAVCITSLVLIGISHPWKYPVLGVCITIGAGIIGFIFGAWGQSLHQPEFYKSFGTLWSISLSVMAGLCYVGILMGMQKKLQEVISVKRLAISMGILTGMICSTLFHTGLLLLYRTAFGWGYILTALPFGIVGGAILGAVSGWIICIFYRTQPIEPNTREGAIE